MATPTPTPTQEEQELAILLHYRKELVMHGLQEVNLGIRHRLENIRLFTDRKEPNKEVILELLDEIEEHLNSIDPAKLAMRGIRGH